jgi:hypothetical protein
MSPTFRFDYAMNEPVLYFREIIVPVTAVDVETDPRATATNSRRR